jgi:hypothetical protein
MSITEETRYQTAPALSVSAHPPKETAALSIPFPRSSEPSEISGRTLSEEECLSIVAGIRWPEGFLCAQCGGTHCYLIKSRNLRQCSRCRAQVSLTAGTLFESTRLPMTKWFEAIDTVLNCGRMTINNFAERLSLRYKTAWLLKYKIEQAVKNEDESVFVLNIAQFMKTNR